MKLEALSAPSSEPYGSTPEIAPSAGEPASAAVFQSISAIAFAVDSDARIVCSSAGLELFTGLSRDELIGRCYIELLVPEAERERARENLHRQLNGRGGVDRERMSCDRDGNKRIVRWAESVTEDEHG